MLDRTTFTGMLLGDDKLAVLRDADVFVLPSNSENLGIAVVEAMACALPVVISDRVNIWREVQAAGAGRIASCSAARFAEALSATIDDPPAARHMGDCGKTLVRNRFQWPKIASGLEKVYSSLAANA